MLGIILTSALKGGFCGGINALLAYIDANVAIQDALQPNNFEEFNSDCVNKSGFKYAIDQKSIF